MSRPTRSDIHTDTPLMQLSIAVGRSAMGISRTVFPAVPVSKTSDLIRKWDQGDIMRDEFRPRAPGTSASRAGMSATTVAYNCVEWSLDYGLAWEMLADDDLAELDLAALQFLANKARIAEDRAWISEFFATSKWTGLGIGGSADGSPSDKWNATAGVPIADLRTMIRGAQVGAGATQESDRRNIHLIMPQNVFDAIADNANARDYIKYTMGSGVTAEALSAVLGCGPTHVMGGTYDSAAEGATSSLGLLATEGCLAIYVPPVVSRLIPAAGFTVVKPSIPGGSARVIAGAENGMDIRVWDDEDTESTIYRGKIVFDKVQTMASAGVYANNVLS